MVKIRIRTGRGTGTIEVDNNPQKWTGDEFKKIQEARKSAAGERTITSGRGTGSRKLKDVPDPKNRPKYKGSMSGGRGTKSRSTSK